MPQNDADLVVTGPSKKKENVMTPEDYAALKIESLGNIQEVNATSRSTAALAAGVLQAAMARNFDQIGPIEGRTASGIMATPVAGPTTQAKRTIN